MVLQWVHVRRHHGDLSEHIEEPAREQQRGCMRATRPDESVIDSRTEVLHELLIS